MTSKKIIVLVSANQFKEPYPVYPIGLSYISTYFQKHNKDFEVIIYDMNMNGMDGLINTLIENKPMYIGISLRNIDDISYYGHRSFINEFKRVVETVRTQTDAKIIVGGSGFSIFPIDIFELLNVDFGIIGEGEESFSHLILSLLNNESYENIEGLVYRVANKIVLNKRISSIKSLELNFDDNLVPYYWAKSGMLNIQTKRGCPHKCIYCTYPSIDGEMVRTYDPDELVQSLQLLQQKHSIEYVFFTDSIFNIKNDYNKLLAQKIIDSRLNIKWGAYFTLNNLDEEMLSLYKRAGLTHIEFGTDSISNAQLKNYRKHFTVEDVINKSRLCNQLKINIAHFLILGGYGETEESLEETFKNAKKINDAVFFVYIGMRIYPGTILSKIAVDESVISKDDNLLEPKYYISKKVDIASIKRRALLTGKRWIFPDDDLSEKMNKLRKKGWKGPLWEYAKY